jgi:hypothetical protein
MALQLTSTNCIPTGNGTVQCTTMTTPDMSQDSGKSAGGHCGLCNLISIFDGDAKKRHAKAVGKMLSKGDCAGAEKYALEKGDLDLADRVREYCPLATPATSDWDSLKGVDHQNKRSPD